MHSYIPRFRSDLTVLQRESEGGTFFVVKDPVSGQFFRLREAEHFIAKQCDGETPLAVVRQRTEQEFNATLPTEILTAFIENLEKSGLLEREGTAKKKHGRQRRVSGSLLYLQFKAIDPTRLLEYLAPRTRFLFTPHFLVFSAAIILMAAGITITNWTDITGGLSDLYSFSSIPLLVLVVFLVISLHEFAHGLTCKHFGGEVHEIGFLLIYFQPALYCNVSDAWLFPEKSKRLWVGFAGPYFELFLWALATLIWNVTDMETWINYAAFVVMTSSGVKTFLNFNPLIKFDGYYLLSDYLEVPNLRKKSWRYVGNLIERIFRLAPSMAEDLSRRERRILFVYGIVAASSTITLLGYVITTMGGYLIENGQPMAFLLSSGFLVMKFRRKFRKLFGKPSDADPEDGDFFDPIQSIVTTVPDAESAVTPAYAESPVTPAYAENALAPAGAVSALAPVPAEGAPAPVPAESTPAPAPAEIGPKPSHSEHEHKRKKKKSHWSWWQVLVWAALSAAVGAAMFFFRMELRIPGPFVVLPKENADVRSSADGLLVDIFVDEGYEVKAGDVIARIDDQDLLAELRKTEGQILETRAILRKLEAGPTAEEVKVAKAIVNKAEQQLKYAQGQAERFRTLFAEKLVARKDLEDTVQLATTAQGDLAEARSKLNLLVKGTRPEEVDAAKARLVQLEEQKRYIEDQLKTVVVVSPASGIVATPSRQLKEMKHQLVKKGDLIAKVYDFKTVTAQVVIPEKEFSGIEVGNTVGLRTRTYPDELFYGKVTYIGTSAQYSSGSITSSTGQSGVQMISASTAASSSKTIVVTTEIDNHSLLLKPEMTGMAKIYCGQRRLIDLATRRLARTVKVEFWSWW